MAAQRYAVAVQKGGAGKTTTATQLAWGLAARGKRTLVVDLDAQANATVTLLGAKSEFPYTTTDLLFAPGKAPTLQQVDNNLYVIPATLRFSMAERQILSLPPYESPFLLSNALKRVESGFEFILCDLSPALGGVFVNAVIACPTIIAPAEANHLAIQGVPDLQEEIARISASGVAGGPRTLWFLATKCCEHQMAPREALKTIQGLCGKQLLRTRIPRAAAVEQAMGKGLPIFEARFRDSAAQAAFTALLEEFLELAETAHA
jgi:chromosome partitioning protein